MNNLTAVSLSWRKNRRNHRLLFGEPYHVVRLDWRRRLALFQTGQIFGYERWQASSYGTVDWQVYVLQAGVAGDKLCRLPGIKPAASTLLAARGKAQAKRALGLIGGLSAAHQIDALSAEDWRYISHRMQARLPLDLPLKSGPL